MHVSEILSFRYLHRSEERRDISGISICFVISWSINNNRDTSLYPLRIKVRHTVSNLIDRGQLFRKWEKEKKRKKKEKKM